MSIAWGFDGKLLASGGGDDDDDDDDRPVDNKIILWDPKKGERLKTLEGHRLAKFFFCLLRSPGERRRAPLLKKSIMSRGAVLCLVWAPDGSLVASCSGSIYSGGEDRSVRMWSVETGQELKKFLGHRCVVSGSWDNRIKVWNVSDGKCLQTLTGHR